MSKALSNTISDDKYDTLARKTRVKIQKYQSRLKNIIQVSSLKIAIESFTKDQLRCLLDLIFLVFSKKVAVPGKIADGDPSEYQQKLKTFSKHFASDTTYKVLLLKGREFQIGILSKNQKFVKELLSHIFT